mmetsp:Transcript_4983/g.19930  ORF Transcript_4983/g.19930 Transcript_4983/m.19930 type:complete len:292 (-) Transcript_4983:1130-2005(-)
MRARFSTPCSSSAATVSRWTTSRASARSAASPLATRRTTSRRESKSAPVPLARAFPRPLAWPSPSAISRPCSTSRASTSWTTTPGSSAGTAACRKASLPKPAPSLATWASASSSCSTTTTPSPSTETRRCPSPRTSGCATPPTAGTSSPSPTATISPRCTQRSRRPRPSTTSPASSRSRPGSASAAPWKAAKSPMDLPLAWRTSRPGSRSSASTPTSTSRWRAKWKIASPASGPVRRRPARSGPPCSSGTRRSIRSLRPSTTAAWRGSSSRGGKASSRRTSPEIPRRPRAS